MPGIFLISATIFNTTYCGGGGGRKKKNQKKARKTDLMKTITEKLRKGKLCSH